MARKMGIAEGKIREFNGMDSKAVLAEFTKAKTTFMNNMSKKDGKGKSFLFVYCAGHGLADQQQYFVLPDDTTAAAFPIENQLRGLAQEAGCNVVAFYDICREQLTNHPKLKEGIIGGSASGSNNQMFNYVHLCTGPGKLMDAASVMAVDTNKKMEDESRKKGGLLEVPGCFLGIAGLEVG